VAGYPGRKPVEVLAQFRVAIEGVDRRDDTGLSMFFAPPATAAPVSSSCGKYIPATRAVDARFAAEQRSCCAPPCALLKLLRNSSQDSFAIVKWHLAYKGLTELW
jgi:hypothetical protein